jgi:hypothetical protein
MCLPSHSGVTGDILQEEYQPNYNIQLNRDIAARNVYPGLPEREYTGTDHATFLVVAIALISQIRPGV